MGWKLNSSRCGAWVVRLFKGVWSFVRAHKCLYVGIDVKITNKEARCTLLMARGIETFYVTKASADIARRYTYATCAFNVGCCSAARDSRMRSKERKTRRIINVWNRTAANVSAAATFIDRWKNVFQIFAAEYDVCYSKRTKKHFVSFLQFIFLYFVSIKYL